MAATVVINTFAGLLFLIPIVFVLSDVPELVSLPSSQPLPTIFKKAVGSSGGAFALLIPIIVLALICGTSCTTATSWCIWAFARDGAIPYSKWWVVINRRLDVPLNAMTFSMAIQLLLGLLYFGSLAAFNAFSGVGVICLTISYVTPIAISVATGRKKVRAGTFYLGSFGYFCNIIAIGMYSLCFVTTYLLIVTAWSLLAIPLFCMPSYIPAQVSAINYAPAVFISAMLFCGIWYWTWGYKNYTGPPTLPDTA